MRKLLTILLLLIIGNAFSRTIVVGKNRSINTLRQGIKLAKDGDTILLNKGVYKEGNIIIDRAIFLLGIDQPVLDGDIHRPLTHVGFPRPCAYQRFHPFKFRRTRFGFPRLPGIQPPAGGQQHGCAS